MVSKNLNQSVLNVVSIRLKVIVTDFCGKVTVTVQNVGSSTREYSRSGFPIKAPGVHGVSFNGSFVKNLS